MPQRNDGLAAMDAFIGAKPRGASMFAVLLVRIQRTREINILFGYDFGRRLMQAAADVIASVLRPVDMLVTLGEFEYALVLPDLLGSNHALLAAHRVVRAFRQPLAVDGHAMMANVAVGVAVGPQHGSSADALCRRADIAYGEALRSGEHVAMFVPREQYLDVPYGDLRRALEDGQLQVHLQPILDVRSRRIVAAESLARWHSPLLGPISPDVFVPLAEQTGLIGELTRWSMNATLRYASLAQLGERGMRFALNLSPRVFLDHSFDEQLLAALKIWDVPATAVVLEVTEGGVMEDPARSAAVLTRLREAGMSIAIDDFGTGYASFAYLKRFPANEVKVDQSFIRDICHDDRTAELVRSMIDLSHRLEMRVVAEGVEDEETMQLLATMDCDLVQGFHLGRPQPAEAFIAALPAR
jgi:diguanylate cyclase